jgi:hypothetical protein
MVRKRTDIEFLDLKQAAQLLEKEWQTVVSAATAKPDMNSLLSKIAKSQG